MKVAFAVCMALLALILVQAEDEMAPPVLAAATRIANGRPAAPREFPYMARIVGSDDSGRVTANCGGCLVTRSAVLTSADCVYSSTNFTVQLGTIYRTAEDPNAWSVESMWAMHHPKFNNNNGDNNIGIIHLPRLAPLNEFIELVYLPCSPVHSSYLGRQGIVAGWGRTAPGAPHSDVLRWAEVVVIPNEYCKKFAPSSLAVTHRQLCAGSFSSTVYWGDGGAPLFLYTRGRYIQIGIFSAYTNSTFNTSYPVTYTRVTSFLDWIKVNTESD